MQMPKFLSSGWTKLVEPDNSICPLATFPYDGLKEVLHTARERLSHVAQYYTYFVHNCLRKTDGSWLRSHDLQDACQDGLSSIWVMAHVRGTEPDDYLASYLWVSHCRAADIGRKRGRETRALKRLAAARQHRTEHRPADSLERAELQEIVDQLINGLPARRGRVVQAYLTDYLELPEWGKFGVLADRLSAATGQPQDVGTVKNLCYLGCHTVADGLRDRGYGPADCQPRSRSA
jgi:DNA-directed RNA polymerase specialized sigma24 family protein